jgi:hypothetical protein
MTTKERLHKLVDELSEAEADETLRFAVARRAGGNVDEWGDLDAFGDALMGDALHRLDEEERTAFGETIAGRGSARARHEVWRGLVERASDCRSPPGARPDTR